MGLKIAYLRRVENERNKTYDYIIESNYMITEIKIDRVLGKKIEDRKKIS